MFAFILTTEEPSVLKDHQVFCESYISSRPVETKMRHKWADVIEAYINGKQIQVYLDDKWSDCFTLESSKRAGIPFPDFNNQNRQWRIKPEMMSFKCRLALHQQPYTNRFYVQGYDNEVNKGINGWFNRGENPPDSTFVRWLTDYIEFFVPCETNHDNSLQSTDC